MEKRYVPIEEMLKNIEEDVIDLIQVGYEQAACNEEGMVDHGDAIRIYLEDKFGDTEHGFQMSILPECYRLYGTLLEIRSRKRWEEEFPSDVTRFPSEYNGERYLESC